MHLTPAKPCEFEAIRKFYWDLIDAMKDRSDTVGWKKGIYPSDSFLKSSLDNGELYVIRDGSGYAASVIVNSLCNEDYEGVVWGKECDPGKVIVPHALAVRPDLHGQGTGKTVVGDILQLGRNMKKESVRLDILTGNTAAIRLYESTGFRFVQEKSMFYEDTGRTVFLLYECILTGKAP